MAKQKTDPTTGFRKIFCSFEIDSIDEEVEHLLHAGILPKRLLDASRQCMEEIGKKFESGEYYLPELVVAGEMFKKVSERIRPYPASAHGRQGLATLVLGTPRGDIHNLGKDIFRVLAESGGFLVHDLGVDVAPEAFVRKVQECRAEILGMSALVTAAFGPMVEVVGMLEERGMRDRVFVLVGGGVTTPGMARKMRVDAQTQDAYEGLRIISEYAKKKGQIRTTG